VSPLLFAFAVLIVAVGFLSAIVLMVSLCVAAKHGDEEMERRLEAERKIVNAEIDRCREARTHRVFVDGLGMPVRRQGDGR
jgi:hypothetical protein